MSSGVFARAEMSEWFCWPAGKPSGERDVERGERTAPEEIQLEEIQGRQYAEQRSSDLVTGASLACHRRQAVEEESAAETAARAQRLAEEVKRCSAAQKKRTQELKERTAEAERQRRILDREEALNAMCSNLSGRAARCCSCSWCTIIVFGVSVVCCLPIGVLSGELPAY